MPPKRTRAGKIGGKGASTNTPQTSQQAKTVTFEQADATLTDASAKDLDRLLERRGSRTRARKDEGTRQLSTDTRQRGGTSTVGSCGFKALSEFEAEHQPRFVSCIQLDHQR